MIVIKDEPMGLGWKQGHKEQLRCLLADTEYPEWEKAHLTLYILNAIRAEDSIWLGMLERFNTYYHRHNEDGLLKVIGAMKRDCGWTPEDESELNKLKFKQ